MHLFVVHPMIFCPRHLSFGQTNVSAVSISLRNFVAGLTALLWKHKCSVVASNAPPRCPSLKRGTVFAILGIHQQKVIFKQNRHRLSKSACQFQ